MSLTDEEKIIKADKRASETLIIRHHPEYKAIFDNQLRMINIKEKEDFVQARKSEVKEC